MKKYILALLLVGLFIKSSFAVPNNTMSITPSATDATTITASDENTRNSAISTTYNAHSHTDITSLGTVTTGVWNGTIIGTTYGGTGTGNGSFLESVGIGHSSPSAMLHIRSSGTGSGFALRIADTTPTDRLVVQDNGNVGIGTTAPTTLLQVAGTANATTLQEGGAGVPNVNDNLSVFASTTSSQLAGVISDETGTAGKLVFDTSPVLVTPTLGAATATTLDTGQGANELYDMNQNVQTTDDVTFDILRASTAPNGGLKVLTGGNVGIGTTNPLSLLQVGSSPNAPLVVLAGGNVGIGKTSPSSLLEVAGDILLSGTTPAITIGDAGEEDTQINFDGNAQDYHIGLDDTDDSLKLGLGTTLGTTDHIVSDSSGRVTQPLQPCFLVQPDASQTNIATGTTTTIIYQTENFDIGSNFSSNTFTAPVTGKYLLTASVTLIAIDTASSYYSSMTTSNRTYYDYFPAQGISADFQYNFKFSVIADMDVNDTVTISVYQDGGTQQTDVGANAYFSGSLIN